MLNIIFGSTFDESLEGRVRVSVVATGIESIAGIRPEPIIRNVPQATAGQALPNLNQTEIVDITAQVNTPSITSELQNPKIKRPFAWEPQTQSIQKNGPMPMQSTIESPALEQEIAIKEAPLPENDKLSEFLSNNLKDEDVFIPAEPTKIPATENTANPFAAADMVNANKEPGVEVVPRKSSGLSLFERVTGVSRGDKKRAEVKVEEPMASKIVAEIQPQLKIAAGTINEISVETKITPEPDSIYEPIGETGIELDTEPKDHFIDGSLEERILPPKNFLGELDSADRVPMAEDQEDILEIPAFLRRQAN